jgi:hypothetical protein
MSAEEPFLVKHGYYVGLALAAVGVMAVGLELLWRNDGMPVRVQAPPAATPARPPAAATAAGQPDAALAAYVRLLVKDAWQFEVPLELDALLAPLPYARTEGTYVLPAADGRLETADLRIGTEVRRLPTPMGGLGVYQAPTLVLTVENRTDHFVAFRVVTEPSGKINCLPKAHLKQPTLVLAPREALARTECLAARGGGDQLTVHLIEVVRVPELSYHYLRQLKPVALGLGNRVTEGHVVLPGRPTCGGTPRQAIEQGYSSGAASFADVIDFYSRNRCERHDFKVGYRRRGPPAEARPVLAGKVISANPPLPPAAPSVP